MLGSAELEAMGLVALLTRGAGEDERSLVFSLEVMEGRDKGQITFGAQSCAWISHQ
jgi:hypothetical protein